MKNKYGNLKCEGCSSVYKNRRKNNDIKTSREKVHVLDERKKYAESLSSASLSDGIKTIVFAIIPSIVLCFTKEIELVFGCSILLALLIYMTFFVISIFIAKRCDKRAQRMVVDVFKNELNNSISEDDEVYESPGFRTMKTNGVTTHLCVCWEKEIAWLKADYPDSCDEEEIIETEEKIARLAFFRCRDIMQYNSILDELGGNAFEVAHKNITLETNK